MVRKKVFSSGVLVILLIACVAFSSILFGCTPTGGLGNPFGGPNTDGEEEASPPTVTEWVLPIVVSITGADAGAGLAAAWGFDHGVKTVNEQGGIRGIPVKITIRDAASSDTEVTSEIGVVASDALIIVGPPTEALFKAGEQAFYNAGMPAVGAATDVNNREAFKPFAISCITDPGSETISAMETWAKTERFTNVTIFYTASNAERTLSARDTLVSLGKGIAQVNELVSDAFDAASVAEKAFTSGADAYYIDMNSEDSLRIIRQLKFLAGEEAANLKILCGPQAADMALLEAAEEGELLGIKVWATLDPGKEVERHKAFDEAYEKNVEDAAYYGIAVDYYQSAIMLKQAIDSLELTGAPGSLVAEREKLANYLYNSGLFSTDQGDFIIVDGNKHTAARLYTITEEGFKL